MRKWLLFGLAVAAVLLRYGYDRWRVPLPPPADRPPLAEGLYDVVRAVDGDTLMLRQDGSPNLGARGRRGVPVRLLGIDCPESVKPNHPVERWGAEASAFTRSFVFGKPVRLQFDRRRVDRYDRYLAYVFIGDRMLNEELVRAGLARVWTMPGDSQSVERRLRKAEREAQEQSRGIWSDASAERR